jgi:hypothetical protein
MKEIKLDKKKAREEESNEALKKAEQRMMNQALEDFHKSYAYPYVMKFFQEYENQLIGEITDIQTKEMKEVFLLPAVKQKEKIINMSKRDLILTAVLSIILKVKRKL